MNPVTASKIQHYPERRTDGRCSEVWHGEKILKEIPPDQLCPHYINGARQFYVNEYAQLVDQRIVIPKRWLLIDQQLHAEAWIVTLSYATGLSRVDTHELFDIHCDMFELDFFRLTELKLLPKMDCEHIISFEKLMPCLTIYQ
jgi:hypothetical protein